MLNKNWLRLVFGLLLSAGMVYAPVRSSNVKGSASDKIGEFPLSESEASEGVNITADRLEIIKKGEINLFRGNVKLSSLPAAGKSPQNVITAERLKHFIPQQKVEAEGNVRFVQQRNSGEELKILSQKVVYNYKNQYCLVPCTSTLSYLSQSEPGERIDLFSRKTQFFGKERRILAQGNIQASYQQYQIQSGVLEYLEETGKIVLTEQPEICYQNKENFARYTGEKITILRKEKKIVIEGGVKGIIYAKSKE